MILAPLPLHFHWRGFLEPLHTPEIAENPYKTSMGDTGLEPVTFCVSSSSSRPKTRPATPRTRFFA